MLNIGFIHYLNAFQKKKNTLGSVHSSLKIIEDYTFDIAKLILKTVYTPKLRWTAEESILLP